MDIDVGVVCQKVRFVSLGEGTEVGASKVRSGGSEVLVYASITDVEDNRSTNPWGSYVDVRRDDLASGDPVFRNEEVEQVGDVVIDHGGGAHRGTAIRRDFLCSIEDGVEYPDGSPRGGDKKRQQEGRSDRL